MDTLMERIDRYSDGLYLCFSGVALPPVVLIQFDGVKVDCRYVYR